MAYIDVPSYKNFVDTNSNVYLEFCKKLATKTTTTHTYKERLMLLQGIFPEDIGVTDVKLINARCNVSFIVTSFFKSEPSAFETRQCLICTSLKLIPSPTIILGFTNFNLNHLETNLKEYIKSRSICCADLGCNGELIISRKLGQHLFIETDFISEYAEYSLADLPNSLLIDDIG